MDNPLLLLISLIQFLWVQMAPSTPQELSKQEPYTSYFSGNPIDKKVQPDFGITMMGGRSEHDAAMKWFLAKAKGGDVLVLRASGSDGYNEYLYSKLGVEVNSVESLVINSLEAANHPYVIDKIEKAEVIWMAGGNQFNYVNIWGQSKMKRAINRHINKKRGAIGGTSAGMAVLGEWYFSAENGTIQSEEALANPYHEKLKLGNDFLEIDLLQHTITDTHYADRNRQGRHAAFISRIVKEEEKRVFGIACDEYTAVCIEEDGLAKVFGKAPEKANAVYFIQSNCSNASLPEKSVPNQSLTWIASKKALSVYRIMADASGNDRFDLNTWADGSGGEWFDWYIDNGNLIETPGLAPNCKK